MWSGRTRTCEVRVGTTGLRPAPFAARMHAPLPESADSASSPRSTSRNEKSRRGLPGRLSSSLFAGSLLATPPKAGLVGLGRVPPPRAHDVVAGKQTPATGRFRGPLCRAKYLAQRHHDFSKVNDRLLAVK